MGESPGIFLMLRDSYVQRPVIQIPLLFVSSPVYSSCRKGARRSMSVFGEDEGE
jgi:hypothetical protein